MAMYPRKCGWANDVQEVHVVGDTRSGFRREGRGDVVMRVIGR